MANKRHKPEEIVTKLRQVDVPVGQGMARVDAIREVRVTEQTYCRWRKQLGGMGTDQLKELKRLRKAVSDLTLDKLILAEAARGNFWAPPGAGPASIMRGEMKVSERRVCRLLGHQHRSTQRHRPRGRPDEEQLVADIIELARRYGRYANCPVAARIRLTLTRDPSGRQNLVRSPAPH